MSRYFKITNKDEMHYGFQYVDGINVLKEKFNDNINDVDCPGGFYFADESSIHMQNYSGYWIREIELPNDDPEFKIVAFLATNYNIWRANKIILGNRYSLFDLNTYERLGLDFKKFNLPIRASVVGNLNFFEEYVSNINKNLDTLDDLCDPIYVPINTIMVDRCSQYGHIDILKFLMDQEFTFNYNKAIDLASQNGHIHILEWFYGVNKNLRYTWDAIDLASANGHDNVLEWWKQKFISGTNLLEYSSAAIHLATKNGHINVLEWWKNSDLPLKYTINGIKFYLDNKETEIAKWWKIFCPDMF